MDDKVAVILMSHCHYAKATLESVEMIMGKQENVGCISLTSEKGLDDLSEELDILYQQLNCSKGLIILADLLGGTPSNAASMFVLQNDNVYGYAGYGLTNVLECLSQRTTLQSARDALTRSSVNDFVYLNELLDKE